MKNNIESNYLLPLLKSACYDYQVVSIARLQLDEANEMARHFQRGDCVVYRKQKFSVKPGKNATHIWACESGDGYSYCVDKFYRVISVEDGGHIRIRTRKGKELSIRTDDPALRPARLWERLVIGARFPALPENAVTAS